MEPFPLILLAGGSGTRLRALYPVLPKPLVPVAGRPFLDWVCRYWARQGVRRVVLSVGHLAEAAERYAASDPCPPLQLETIREETPLGTGGAIRHAARAAGDPFIAANADSLVLADLSAAAPLMADPSIDGVLVGLRREDTSRYGSLDIAPGSRLIGYREKQPGAGWINGGIYYLRQRLLERFPAHSPLSMETDVFPALLASGAHIHVLAVDAPFLDIGTPESLARAGAFIERHAREFEPKP